MKALEILTKLNRKDADSISYLGIRKYELYEAIAELQKLQEENEHLKNMLQAHTKEK